MANEIIVDMGSALKAINAMGRRVDNTGELTAAISEVMMSDISDHFLKEEGPDGPWQALSENTKKNRKPGKILQQQGKQGGLLGSLSPLHDSQSASVTANKTYAAAHNYGLGARSVVGTGRRVYPRVYGATL